MKAFSSMVRDPSFVFLVIALGIFTSLPASARLGAPLDSEARSRFISLQVAAMQNATAPQKRLPAPLPSSWKSRVRVPITAYSSDVGQTDATPLVTASGSRVRDGIVAANFLPIGTKVKLPELYGDKVFTVEDRMNARYGKAMDIWMPDRASAIRFGRKHVEVVVLK
jgi:3D (Asp-Asp-Asp) domain-containing protein